MGKIFYNPSASSPEPILQFRWSKSDDEMMTAPVGAAYIEYDPSTNIDLILEINSNWDNFRIDQNGILYQNGQPVTINPPGEEWNANADIKSGYPILPDWIKTASADQVQQWVTNNVWSGQTKAQVNTWIDQNITGTNVATLRTQLITALKLVAGAIIDLRDLMAIEAKLIIYLRDLVLRFKKL